MQRSISEFFHRLGIIFSIFTFITFELIVSSDSKDAFLLDISGCFFIYCFARFIGWIISGLMKYVNE
ncbi:hypothetical protein GRW09_22905 [Escherichia coli]|nr:hypothetical protein [Escherichia coli]